MVHLEISPVFFRVIRTEEYFFSFSVHCSRCCFTNQFCFTITIKVIYHKLGVVGTGTDIFS